MTTTLVLARENRVMITEIRNDISEIKNKVEEMFNHMSTKLPIWVTVLFTVLGSLVTGLIVATVI